MVINAAQSLDVQPTVSPRLWTRRGRRRVFVGGGGGRASCLGAGGRRDSASLSALCRWRRARAGEQPGTAAGGALATAPGLQDRSSRSRQLPADAAETILVGSYPVLRSGVRRGRSRADRVARGNRVQGVLRRRRPRPSGTLATRPRGAYTDPVAARRDVARLQSAARSERCATGDRRVCDRDHGTVSLILDALRRKSTQPDGTEPADRPRRADAVLASLGYPRSPAGSAGSSVKTLFCTAWQRSRLGSSALSLVIFLLAPSAPAKPGLSCRLAPSRSERRRRRSVHR